MIEGLKPYAEYKESGLPWLDTVPKHWNMVPNRALMRDQRQVVGARASDYKLLSLTLRGVIVRDMVNPKGKFPAQFNTYKVVKPYDFVFCLFDIDETPRGVGLSPFKGMITGAYDIFSPTNRINPRFLYHYYLFVDERKLMKPLYTGLRKTIQRGVFASLKAPFPPLDEQAAIVRFLDHANRKIDGFIRAKRKLIGLLNEQKQAIIHRAVTRGLNPNAPLKPSGIPWLGDIPKHWEVVRSRRLFTVRTELARPDDVQLSATQSYGVIPQAEYEAKIGRRVVKISMHLEKRRHVEKDDFVISMRSFQGGIERAWAAGAIRSSYVVMKPDPAVDVSFFSYVLKSPGYIRALQATGDFIRDGQDLTYGNFRMVDLPLMPLPEQKEIAAYIGSTTKALNTNIARTEREIALMQEYRTRLTADLVTGKLDVREAAAKLPETPSDSSDMADLSEMSDLSDESSDPTLEEEP